MKYLLLVCWDAEHMNAQVEPDPAEAPAEDEEKNMPWIEELGEAWITGDQLAPPRRAQTVRVRGGKPLVTDGPFAETKEALGGFYVIEADSPGEAEQIAARVPSARMGGTVEVRPVVQR